MLKGCAEAVQRLFTQLVKTAGLSTPSTVSAKYLTSQVFLCTGLWPASAQSLGSFAQAFLVTFNQFGWALYTISTSPTKNTNLIKGLLTS